RANMDSEMIQDMDSEMIQETPYMDSEMIQETPYIAAMNGEWQHMIDYYKKNLKYLFSPVTLSLDTGFHLAVHSNEERPLKDLLGIMEGRELEGREFILTQTRNKYGNTVLHEATIYGNYEAVRFLVECCPDLISITNNFGETPLFTAAGFGEAEIVEFLIATKPEQCVFDKINLLSIHRQRWKDDLSILGAAIIGQHYETALLLLELDESLHSLKDKNGITALQLLAHMPSAFESGFPMGIFERLIYCCLPVSRKVKLQVETSGQARKDVGDVESGLERKPRGYLKVLKERCWSATLEGFWNHKRKHVFALSLAKNLIAKDESWNRVRVPVMHIMEEEENGKGENEFLAAWQTSVTKSSLIRKEDIPLLIATRYGIEEIVGEIIKQHPHTIEQLNDKGQSILDVAVMHRQKEIFSLVKQRKIPLARLHRVIDKKGYTLLHHVAVMTEHSRATKPGPALQLQEELQWFEQVQKVIPSHYVTLRNKEGKTADELFKE
ncbi:hypothetical protein D5086_021657, partial [Populus alba]